jgi:Domain of unknown function (DUF4157)
MARMLLTTRSASATRSSPRLKPRSVNPRALLPAISVPAQVHNAFRAVDEVRPSRHRAITPHTGLLVEGANHAHEREAERIADKAMPMRDSKAEGSTSLAAPRKIGSLSLQPLRATAPAPEAPILGQKTLGRPMAETTRMQMESHFGADFSGVRIHADRNAVQVSRALNAQALTIGNHIFFDMAKYDAGSAAGRRLLAHELSHVVQRQRGDVAPHVIQRDVAGVQRRAPPVDCATAITATYTCFDLIAEMSRLRFDMAENDSYLARYRNGELPWDADVIAIRLQAKTELQEKFDGKERIRAACCAGLQVPPLAPTAPPEPVAPVTPPAPPEPKVP